MCPLHASYCLWAKFYFIIAHEVVSLFWLLLLVFMLKLHVQSYHATVQCNDYLRAYAFTMVSTCGSGIIQAEVQHKFYRVYLPEATSKICTSLSCVHGRDCGYDVCANQSSPLFLRKRLKSPSQNFRYTKNYVVFWKF